MELSLSAEQEATVIEEHGSLEYIQTYVDQYIAYLASKQEAKAKQAKIATLMALPEAELDVLVSAAEVKKAEALEVMPGKE